MNIQRRRRRFGEADEGCCCLIALIAVIACIWWAYSKYFSNSSDGVIDSVKDKAESFMPQKQPSAEELAEAAKECQKARDYMEGLDYPIDMQKAKEHLTKAAELGDAEAQAKLAAILYSESKVSFRQDAPCLRDGLDRFKQLNDIDLEKINQAGQWAQKAARQGSADAQALLGNICLVMVYAKYDNTLVKNYNDNPDDFFKDMDDADKTAQQAFKCFQKAADQGSAEAQGMLGTFYESGFKSVVNKDPEKAEYWYTKAANQGNVEAMESLRQLYRSKGDAQQEQYWQEHIKKQIAVDKRKELEAAQARAAHLTEKAKQGEVWAMEYLAVLYHNSIQHEENTDKERAQELLEKTLYWLIKAAENGSTTAKNAVNADDLYALSLCFMQGSADYINDRTIPTGSNTDDSIVDFYNKCVGFTKDSKKGCYYLQKAADWGNAYAQYELALCYAYGKHAADGIPKNHEKALHLLKKTADRDKSYKDDLARKAAAQLLFFETQKKAQQGDAGAQYRLGQSYEEDAWKLSTKQGGEKAGKFYTGLGYDEQARLRQARQWYTKAAENGNADAQFLLVKHYSDDTAKALYWCTKAAENGNADAQCLLGDWYLYGAGGANQDNKESAYWYAKAAENGNAKAQYELAQCYAYGRGVAGDREKAKYWNQKAAEQHYIQAVQFPAVSD